MAIRLNWQKAEGRRQKAEGRRQKAEGLKIKILLWNFESGIWNRF
jgi:hypothetical protein